MGEIKKDVLVELEKSISDFTDVVDSLAAIGEMSENTKKTAEKLDSGFKKMKALSEAYESINKQFADSINSLEITINEVSETLKKNHVSINQELDNQSMRLSNYYRELRAELTDLDSQIKSGVSEIEEKQEKIEEGQEKIEERLENIEKSLNKRALIENLSLAGIAAVLILEIVFHFI